VKFLWLPASDYSDQRAVSKRKGYREGLNFRERCGRLPVSAPHAYQLQQGTKPGGAYGGNACDTNERARLFRTRRLLWRSERFTTTMGMKVEGKGAECLEIVKVDLYLLGLRSPLTS